MKTTDLAMIFVAIILPIVIIVYIDISFLLKSEEKRLYYINIINSAIDDATYAMKTVEAEDLDLDYGYSGLAEKRVAINPNIAVNTFFSSLYDHFEITGDIISENYMKQHIPAMAILDYNGVYIYSIDDYQNITGNKEYSHILKPKRYYTYTYGINNSKKLIPQEQIESMSESQIDALNLFTVIFTMDDFIYKINDNGKKTGFYIEDNKNNLPLYTYELEDGTKKDYSVLRDEIIRHLRMQRSAVISKVVSDEMSYAINAHNNLTDIKYTFYFPKMSLSEWDQMVDNIGIIAFMQGINIGNVRLDYNAHGISGLNVKDKFYVTEAWNGTKSLNYYHVTKECPVYTSGYKPITGYYLTKIDASSVKYYPCPICNP